MKSVVWYFSLGFLIYAKISLSVCYFWFRKIYFLNCYENFMLALWMYVVATIIFIELIDEFWYRFLYSPNYLNELIKGIKEII
jgi:hypothetical protein